MMMMHLFVNVVIVGFGMVTRILFFCEITWRCGDDDEVVDNYWDDGMLRRMIRRFYH